MDSNIWRLVCGAALAIVPACGDDGGSTGVCNLDGGEACFALPTAAMVAHGEGADGPASIGCGAYVAAESTLAVELSGQIKNYSGGTAIPDATLQIFTTPEYDSPVATVVSDADGNYTADLPSGTPELLFGKLTAAGFVDLFLYGQHPDLSQATLPDVNFTAATEDFLETIAALVETDLAAGTAQLAVVVLDCDGRNLEHAVVVLSSTSGERDFVDGSPVYYGVAGDFPLPVTHDERADTNDNGAAAVMNVAVGGTVYLQSWGFPDAAAVAEGEAGLVLVGETEVKRGADAGTGVNLWANQE